MRKVEAASGTASGGPTFMSYIGVPEGEKKEQEIGNLLEKIRKEKFSNLMKEIDMQVQGAQGIPNKMDAKRHTPTHHN